MSKELEALDRLYKCNDDDYTMGYQHHDYKLLQEALQRLEATDNTKPNAALEGLKSLDIQTRFMGILDVPSWEKYLPIIKQALLKAQEQEKENAEYAEYKKALEIIIEKNVNIIRLKFYIMSDVDNALNHYNNLIARDMVKQLTQEELDLLKRYLK